MRRIDISIYLALALLLASCSTTKHVEEGQHLLSKLDLRLDSTAKKDELRKDELLPYIGQKTNTKVFGTFNWSLGIYNLSKKGSNSWLSRRLRKWGEAPVLYNPQEAEYSRASLSSALYNMGYLGAEVSQYADTIGEKKIRSVYDIKVGDRYQIAQHQERIKDPVIASLLSPQDTLLQKRDFPHERYSSFLRQGEILSPNAMQAERKRISQILRNRGHWAFREDNIHFEVDTLGGKSDAWVRTVIDTTSSTYRIGRVSVLHTKPGERVPVVRERQYGGVNYYNLSRYRLSPKFLDSRIWLRPGELYAQDMASRTYSALSDIAAIRSTSISYEVDSTQSVPTIDVTISTQPERSKEITVDLVGTHSGGNLGSIASVALQHNNIFGGAERLRLMANIGYEELQASDRNHLNYGFETSLHFPKLIIPGWSTIKQRQIRGTTDISLNYSYLTRPEFKRDLFSTSWGYSWSHYRHPAFRYVAKLLEVDYMHFGYMDASFLSTVPDYDRMLNYRNQLIVGASLQLSYNSSADYRRMYSRYQHNVRLYLQTAGSLLTAYARLAKAEKDSFGAYTVKGANIVQFFKGEIDYSGLYRLSGKNALAYHAALSTVVPYGNSNFLPIDLRYFSGGASSLRGWRARGLGPGSMPRSVGTSIFHQVGDIKLDLSTELRLRISPSWELATFADAGNIWTARKYSEQPGGNFSLGRFYKELALSVGMGLRWDFDYFLLRLDAGLQLYDPQESNGQRWVIGKKSLGNITAIHFALGYPF